MYAVKVIFCKLCLLLLCSPVLATTSSENELPTESYRIQVPDNWNGDLIVWENDQNINDSKIKSFEGLSPLASLRLNQGFAIVTSGLRMDSQALFELPQNNDNLIQAFIEQVGTPNKIYTAGDANDNLTLRQYANNHKLNKSDMSCSTVSKVAGCDIGLGVDQVYSAVCANVKDAFLAPQGNDVAKDQVSIKAEIDLAVNACTGILTPKVLRTPGQQMRLEEIMTLTGLSKSALMSNVSYQTVTEKNSLSNRGRLISLNKL